MAITSVTDYYSSYASYMNQSDKTRGESETEEKIEKTSVLEQMKDKYSDFEVTVGTFSQSQISSKNKGFQGVMISSAYLAKAENDGKTAKDLDDMLSGVESAYNWLKNAFAKDGSELVSCGYYIDDKGNMGSYSVIKKKGSMFDGLQKQSDDMDKRIKEKREKKAQEKKDAEKVKEQKQEEKKSETEDNKQKLEGQKTGNHVDYSI